jgi:hypothetical protein
MENVAKSLDAPIKVIDGCILLEREQLPDFSLFRPGSSSSGHIRLVRWVHNAWAWRHVSRQHHRPSIFLTCSV